MKTSEQINEIAAALAKAQGEMKPAAKDAINPHFRSKYADLAANVEAARGPLSAHGLSHVQEPVTTDRGIAVTTRLMHSSGQWIEFEALTVPLSKADAHGVGSATTYARRYALGAALGLVAEDDDGTAAVQAAPAKAAAKPPAAKPAAASMAAPISEAQRKRMFAIAKEHGWKDEEVKALLKRVLGVESSKDVSTYRYKEVIQWLELGVDAMANNPEEPARAS